MTMQPINHSLTIHGIVAGVVLLLALVQTSNCCSSNKVNLTSTPVPCMMDLRYEFQNCCQNELDFPFHEIPWVCDYDYMFWKLSLASPWAGIDPPLIFQGAYNDPKLQRAYAKCFTRGRDHSACCLDNEFIEP